MSKALELAKFGRESAPTGLVVGDSDAQTLSSKTFSDMPTFSGGTANGVAYLNASKVLTTASGLVFDGTNFGVGTSSPNAKLHVAVAGDNETVIARFGTTSTGSVLSQLKVLSDPSTNTVKFDATGSSSQDYSFMSGGTARMRIGSTGFVAIGTDTLNYNGSNTNAKVLTVAGDGTLNSADGRILLVNPRAYASITAGSTTAGRMYFGLPNASGGTTAEFASIDALSYGSGGASGYGLDLRFNPKGDNGASFTAMTVKGTGNVGVGTTAPGYKFVVSNATNTGRIAAFFNSTAGGVAVGDSGFIHIGGAQAGSYYGVDIGFVNSSVTPSVHQSNMVFRTAYAEETPQERMRITYAGNISFGSTGTADRPVHLIGTGNRQYFKAETTTNNIANEAGFEVKTPNSNFLIGSHGSTNALWIYDMNAAAERLRINSSGLVTVNRTGIGLQLGSAADNAGVAMLFAGSNTNKNWLIATQYNVNDALEFTPTSAAGGLANSGSPVMVMLANGKVGIGTTSPGSKLDIQNAGTVGINIKSTSASGGAGLTLDTGATAGYSNQILFANTGTSKWALGGKDIGSASGDQFSIYNYGAGANFFTIDTTGNTSIGTVNPSAKLTVAGSSTSTPTVYIGGPTNTTSGNIGYSIHVRDTTAATGTAGMAGIGFSSGPGVDWTAGKWWTGTASYFSIRNASGSISDTPAVVIDTAGNMTVTGHVQSNNALRVSNIAREHFYSYVNTASGGGNVWVHMKTNRLTNESVMYAVEFHGYSYGESKPILCSVGWYNYGGSDNAISIGSTGSHTCGVYKSSDGYAVITINITSMYYCAFSLSQAMAAMGVYDISISASTTSSSSTGAY